MILKSIKFFLQYMSLQSALEKLDDQTKVVFSEEIEMTLQRLLHFYYIEKISISAQSWVKADRIFYFLFEHLMGRAVFSSWKLSSKLVGVQHGTYSIGRLGQYLSLSEVKDFDYPEVVVSEGEGQRFFLNLFRPDLRVEKLGALRSDVFFNSLKTIKKDSDINKNSKCGLVVLGLHENKDLLKIVADSSVKDELCWVIKFHPKSTNDQKSQIKAKLNHKNVEFLSESIVDFSRFDFCIFFDSSLGVECFELGIPTMSCKSSERVECLSPFSKSFLQSSGADHFHIQNRIDLLNSLIEYDQHKSKIEKDWFFSNKGKALNYWLEYFLDESN